MKKIRKPNLKLHRSPMPPPVKIHIDKKKQINKNFCRNKKIKL